MELDWFTLTWLVGGVILMASEIVIPGGVVFFVGLGGLLVGMARTFGLLESWVHAFTAWFLLSLVLLLAMRKLVSHFVSGDSSVQSTDEDADAYGQEVSILETVHEDNHDGRIHFRGSSWPATCLDGPLEPGTPARIAYRDNVVWVIEKMDRLE